MTVYFTRDHEWVAVDGDIGMVGITDYAQEQLGDITFIEAPEIGAKVNKTDAVSVVDSVKAASDVYTPLSGEVVAANDALDDAPETVNTDPEGAGWLFKLRLSDPSELDDLMDRAAYDAYVGSL